MPRSVFLGRVVKQGEPLWLQDDAEAVLEYLREKALACVGCGLPRDETMAPGAEGQYTSRGFKCFACAARATAQAKFEEGRHTEGVYFTAEKRQGE